MSVPLEKLTPEQKNNLLNLSERLIQEDTSVFTDIDVFFAQIYGLDELDVQVIHDTLDVSLPYTKARQRACTPPKPGEHGQFRLHLESLLRPFFTVMGKEPFLSVWKPQTIKSSESGGTSPFEILLLSTQTTSVSKPDEALWLSIVEVASTNGATRIFQEFEGGLAIAILNQYRYWTMTRARLCAAEIIRRFMSIFEDR